MRNDQILVTYGSDLKRMAGELMAAADVQAQLKSGMHICLLYTSDRLQEEKWE